MAASSTNSWLHTSLLSPSAQQQSAQHSVYPTDLPMHHPSSHLAHQHHAALEEQGHHPCDSFCQPLHIQPDFQSAESRQLHDFNGAVGGSGRVGGGGESGSHISARKIHKADREKLRRDRLNEQFAELAGVLDPDRPKNDKATILCDSVQVVRELRAEVKRLRTEQISLLDESRDLAQEKTELREEKATLKNETEALQGQLQNRLRVMLPWMGMDPSLMMGITPYGYPIPVPQAVSAPPSSESNQTAPQVSLPQSVAAAYIPLAPTAPGPFPVHPALQAYQMYANRSGDGSAPYLPYPHYPPQVNSHSHVERPYAQYPSPVQPLPGYLLQMQPHQGQSQMSGAASVPPSMYGSFGPGMAVMPPQTQGNQSNGQSRPNQLPLVPSAQYAASGMQPYSGPVPSSQQDSLSNPQSVQTTLQLQTPCQPQPQKSFQAAPASSTEDSQKAQSGGSGSSSPGYKKETKSPDRRTVASGVSDSIGSSSVAVPASLSSPGVSSISNGEDGVSKYALDSEDCLHTDLSRGHDSTGRDHLSHT